jgi:acetylornithine aminotransferase
LKKLDGIENVRGAGLMIGFDVNESLKDLRKVLLSAHHIFTGEAKPAVIRLLPALNITRQQVDAFLSCIAEAVTSMQQQKEVVV